jgi:hypothetical protein
MVNQKIFLHNVAIGAHYFQKNVIHISGTSNFYYLQKLKMPNPTNQKEFLKQH